jgi:hypothetical protein
MDYKAVVYRLRLNTWEFNSPDEHVIFLGPEAEKQAREYVEWRNRLKLQEGDDAA